MMPTQSTPTRETSSARPARRRDDRGATAVEYALMIGFVAVVMTVGVALLGGALSSGFANAAEGLRSTSGFQDAEFMAKQGGETCEGQQAQVNDKAWIAATCDTGKGEWTCPPGSELKSYENAQSTFYHCKFKGGRP